MEFNELIEARRSVRKYAASEISQAELKAIVTEALEAPSWKNHGWDSLIMGIRDEKKLRAIFDDWALGRCFLKCSNCYTFSSRNCV